MNRRRVLTREGAIRDLLEHAEYIARASFEMGDRFLAEAEETLKSLAQMPEMGNPTDFKNPLLADVRRWPVSRRFKNHIIFYLPLPDGVDALYVFHAARNYQAILERVKRLPL